MSDGHLDYLLRKIRNGDKSAFDAMFQEFYPKMLYVAKSVTHSDEDAKDAVQNAFEKLWKYVINGDSPHIKYNNSYLYTITRREALDIVENKKLFESDNNIETAATVDFDEDSNIVKFDIRSAISRLKEPEQTIAIQFFLFNVKIKDIAKELGEPIGTVKWRISEIKKYFEKVLK